MPNRTRTSLLPISGLLPDVGFHADQVRVGLGWVSVV